MTDSPPVDSDVDSKQRLFSEFDGSSPIPDEISKAAIEQQANSMLRQSMNKVLSDRDGLHKRETTKGSDLVEQLDLQKSQGSNFDNTASSTPQPIVVSVTKSPPDSFSASYPNIENDASIMGTVAAGSVELPATPPGHSPDGSKEAVNLYRRLSSASEPAASISSDERKFQDGHKDIPEVSRQSFDSHSTLFTEESELPSPKVDEQRHSESSSGLETSDTERQTNENAFESEDRTHLDLTATTATSPDDDKSKSVEEQTMNEKGIPKFSSSGLPRATAAPMASVIMSRPDSYAQAGGDGVYRESLDLSHNSDAEDPSVPVSSRHASAHEAKFDIDAETDKLITEGVALLADSKETEELGKQDYCYADSCRKTTADVTPVSKTRLVLDHLRNVLIVAFSYSKLVCTRLVEKLPHRTRVWLIVSYEFLILCVSTFSLGLMLLECLMMARKDAKLETLLKNECSMYKNYQLLMTEKETFLLTMEKLKKLQTDHAEKETQLTKKQEELASVRKEIASLKESKNLLDNEALKLRERLASAENMNSTNAATNEKLKEVEILNATLKDTIKDMQANQKTNEEELQSAVNKLQKFSEQEEALKSKIVDILASKEQLEDHLKTVNEEKAAVEKELSETAFELKGLKLYLAKSGCRQNNKPLNKEKSDEGGWEVGSMISSDSEQDALNNALARVDTIAHLEASLEESRAENERMSKIVSEGYENQRRMEKELEDLRAENVNMKQTQQQAEQQTMEALTKLKVLEEFFESRQVELQKQIGQHIVMSQQHSAQLGSYEELTARLKEEKEHSDAIINELRKEMKEMERENSKLRQLSQKAQNDSWLCSMRSKREVTALQLENKNLRARLGEAESSVLADQSLPNNGILTVPDLDTSSHSSDAEVANLSKNMMFPYYSDMDLAPPPFLPLPRKPLPPEDISTSIDSFEEGMRCSSRRRSKRTSGYS
ncbi:unnamed protein product [Soboliphyme baturini]|uniref:Centrosomal protein of 162 kDa n=1 Tax=Soboliphyme baturini TaxID=241478 RepID=A0A183J407_9BILA|nr:unnamed protein product [Soboliphyme baturini]